MSRRGNWLGIDFSGNVKKWGPGVLSSNVWIAEVARTTVGLQLVDVRPVQNLPGVGHPFNRLSEKLAAGDFRAAGIDAPLSVPASFAPRRGHRALLRLVDALPTEGRPFPTGAALLDALILAPGPAKKPLRACERSWQERKVNVRSTMWNGARGGTPFTVAALKLLALAGRPIWPFAAATTNGLIVEAFPAAQLRAWNIEAPGYSTPAGGHARQSVVRALSERLSLGSWRQTLNDNPDALDAVLAAFAAIAVTEDRLVTPPGNAAKVEGWIAVHDNGRSKPTPATWDSVFERFARFSAQPCLKASGPDFARADVDAWLKPLRKQSTRFVSMLPDGPDDLGQEHIDQILKALGHSGTRTAGRRPSAELWTHLFRAIVLFRADYRCHFCGRSAEEGIQLSSGQRLALRLELDHIKPRAGGGDDFLLSNIRATCRTCNVARGRMSDEDFSTELRSLAAAIRSKHPVK